MVYFWQRHHRSRSTQASTAATMTPTTPSPLSPATPTSALSAFGIGGGGHSSSHFHKSRSSGSSGGGGSGHSTPATTPHSSSNGSLSKSHHIPSSYMLDKLSEYSRRKQETDRRRVAERELDNLNLKIDKLLSKMGEADAEHQGRLKLEEECVVCLAAAATMQTFPCGHKVVCRKCLIKTIQVAVSQRCLPLRCVICRDRILRLHHTMHCQGSSASTPALPSSLTPPLTQSSRSASSPLTPTSPMSLFSLLAGGGSGTKSQSSSPRLLSPTGGASVQALHSPTGSSQSDSATRSMHLAHGTLEDDFLRYTPSDIEAFVNSHNDALNLHTSTEPMHRANNNAAAPTPDHQRHSGNKHGGHHHSLFSSKRNEPSASHSFMHSQSVKIHPEASNQPSSFMDSPNVTNPVPSSANHSQASSSSSSQKPITASKFLAKFLPKSSRRKCNWFRHE